MEPSSPRVAGVIIRDGGVLLMHRSKHGREFYVFPGGTVEAGEVIDETLRREIREETSLMIESFEPLGCWESEFEGQRHDACYFLITHSSGAAALGDGPELRAQTADNIYWLAWLPLSDALSSPLLVPPGIGTHIAHALRQRGYEW